MIDARTGQPHPCPMCNSTDVRWRGRRLYDVSLNWMRFVVETLLSLVVGKPDRAFGGIGHTAKGVEYEAARRAFDEKMSSATPRRFWRCRSCGERGYAFDDVDEVAIGHLSSIEGELAENRGTAFDPVSKPRE